MPSNAAVWLPAKHAKIEVGPAPYTPPGENEIVVRNHAVAINPVDWAVPLIGDRIFPWLKYPCILGEDVAGEVVEVGRAVSRFKVGDRVLGHALGMAKERNRPADGAFQLYTVLRVNMAAPIPDAMAYENAAVIPLGLSTAACGLFQQDYLALHYPSAPIKTTGRTLLIWGGSTSVGSNAIQLAVAAGYEVIATASPKNHGYVQKLGASQAFDYNSKTVVDEVIKAFRGKTSAGAFAIGAGSTRPCLDIVHACEGAKFVAVASAPISLQSLPARPGISVRLVSLMVQLLWASASVGLKSRAKRIRTKFIGGDALANNELGKVIYENFLPRALAEGRYVAAPDALVVGEGLECVQTAFDIQRRGVSARKVVVSL